MLRSEAIGEIPAQTVRVAKAAFPKRSTVIKLHDAFGTDLISLARQRIAFQGQLTDLGMEFFDLDLKIALPIGATLEDLAHLI